MSLAHRELIKASQALVDIIKIPTRLVDVHAIIENLKNAIQNSKQECATIVVQKDINEQVTSTHS